jgi:hypothetical protein
MVTGLNIIKVGSVLDVIYWIYLLSCVKRSLILLKVMGFEPKHNLRGSYDTVRLFFFRVISAEGLCKMCACRQILFRTMR